MTDELDELARIIRYYTGINISSEPDFESELWLFLNKLESLKDQECTKAQLQLLERLKLPSIGTIDVPDDGIFKIARPKGSKPSIYEDMYRYHQKNIDQLIAELSNKENK